MCHWTAQSKCGAIHWSLNANIKNKNKEKDNAILQVKALMVCFELPRNKPNKPETSETIMINIINNTMLFMNICYTL